MIIRDVVACLTVVADVIVVGIGDVVNVGDVGRRDVVEEVRN